MEVRRLSWLGTRTENYAQAREFFASGLGLTLVHEEPGVATFQLPSGEHDYVEVFSVDHPEGAFMTTGSVAGILVDDVIQAREEMEAAGVEMLEPVRWLRDYPGFEHAEYGWFSFRGPDGAVYACTQGARADAG